MSTLKYKLKDGTSVPLFEADYDLAFEVFKKDCRKAKIGDPTECIEAKGICHLRHVREAHVGSGRDAYVVFERTNTRDFPHALHFVISGKSAKVRDFFDQTKGADRQTLWMRAPAKSQHVEARRATLNVHAKRITEQKKAGTYAPKKRAKKAMRMQRLGVSARPRASVAKGIVELL